MLTSGTVLIHDNARSYSARIAQRLFEQFQWDIFEHPPYSPDLKTPEKMEVTRHFSTEKWLEGQRLQTDEELKETVTTH